jgi:hypothetical protein
MWFMGWALYSLEKVKTNPSEIEQLQSAGPNHPDFRCPWPSNPLQPTAEIILTQS